MTLVETTQCHGSPHLAVLINYMHQEERNLYIIGICKINFGDVECI